MPETNQPVADQPQQHPTKKDPLQDFKNQVAHGPLPRLLERLKQEWAKDKWVVVLVATAVTLLVVTLLGIVLGGFLGALGTKRVAPTPLPIVIPTDRPKTPSIFDELKLEIQDFNTILPDPAPPAVDQDISLEPKKN